MLLAMFHSRDGFRSFGMIHLMSYTIAPAATTVPDDRGEQTAARRLCERSGNGFPAIDRSVFRNARQPSSWRVRAPCFATRVTWLHGRSRVASKTTDRDRAERRTAAPLHLTRLIPRSRNQIRFRFAPVRVCGCVWLCAATIMLHGAALNLEFRPSFSFCLTLPCHLLTRLRALYAHFYGAQLKRERERD